MHSQDILPFLARDLDATTPILIAGPTASGKSSLALEIAAAAGGTILNADALQVYGCWQVLTARPSPQDEQQAPHQLYGHVGVGAKYSVGQWLDDMKRALTPGQRPIIVGGTGLYFRALTEGLADIPPVPADVRAGVAADLAQRGLAELAQSLPPDDHDRIDLLNGARVTRALEVYRATGRSITAWQADTPPPLMPLRKVAALVMDADKDWLSARIALRFDAMVRGGALEEVAANLAMWDPADPAFQAIGAPELRDHLNGILDLDDAIERGVISTRQYAKRQRTWFRKRMSEWYNLPVGP